MVCFERRNHHTSRKAAVFAACAMGVIVLALLALTGCVDANGEHGEGANASAASAAPIVDTSAETRDRVLHGKVGCFAASPADFAMQASFPEITIQYFDNTSDMTVATEVGQIDAFCMDEYSFLYAHQVDPNLVRIEQAACVSSNVFMFPKTPEGAARRDQMNAYLAEKHADGTIDALLDKWANHKQTSFDLDLAALPAPNGTLRLGLDVATPPFVTLVDGKIAGVEVELLYGFAERYGYGLRIENAPWSSGSAGLTTGTYDLQGSNTLYNGEFEEKTYFSGPISEFDLVFVTVNASAAAESGPSLFESLTTSFRRSFIDQGLWKRFVDGIGITLMLIALSAVLGTAFGFGLYLLRRLGVRVVNGIIAVLDEILSALPAVLLLLILYYVVFAGTPLDNVAVAVVAFVLIFGFQVLGMMQAGVDAIDSGQYRAALALGFTDRAAFMKIILPQAVNVVLPVYRQSLVDLVKSTAIVGYIAVEDLARATDIIRGHTLEAFMPLVAAALVYYLLVKLLTFLISVVIRRLNLVGRDPRVKLADCLHDGQANVLDASGEANAGGSAPATPSADSAPKPLLRIEHLRKEFGGLVPIADLSASVFRGDIVAVIGPSGTGKSTLLNCINLLDPPTAGTITFDGECITEPGFRVDALRQRIGMVFQSFNLFNHLSIVENCMVAPMALLGLGKRDAFQRAMALLGNVGLAEKAFEFPANLSGGQKQRAAIARTLAMRPDIILLDEPTSALDPASIEEVERVMADLTRSGATMMLVTHDLKLAERLATRAFYLDQGELYEEGTVSEIFTQPKRERTQRFVRQCRTCRLDVRRCAPSLHEANAELFAFCEKNRLGARMSYAVVSVFEELVLQLVVPRAAGEADITFELVYSVADGDASINVEYTGAPIDLDDKENISLRIVSGMTRNLQVNVSEDGGRQAVSALL